MKHLVPLCIAILMFGGCSASYGVITVKNQSPSELGNVQVNVTRDYHDGHLLAAPVDSFDQIYHTGPIKPGELREIRYRSSSEFYVDVQARWTSGSTARFNNGYTAYTLTERHTVDVEDGVILFDGKAPAPIQVFPEENQWRRQVSEPVWEIGTPGDR